MSVPAVNCPQCSVQGQNHFLQTQEVGMSIGCDKGHITTIHIKFEITEITFSCAKTGQILRYEKMKQPDLPKKWSMN